MSIKICLDAGHYGKYNRSPVVPSYYESDMTWKLTNMQKEIYEQKYGITVILTRTNQATDLDLFSRGYKSKGCSLFISNHSNACATESVDYPIAICLLDDKKIEIDDMSREIGDVLAKAVSDVMGTAQLGRVGTRQSGEDRDKNGILDDEYYGVLNGAKQAGTPGIIMEHSFHTNTRATKWLSDDNNLRKMAEAECAVIAGYFGIKKKENSSSSEAEQKKTAEDITSTKKYRVQAGAYNTADAAGKQKDKLVTKGIKAEVVQEDGKYKVQAGGKLYDVKANADAMMQIVINAGFDAFIKVVQEKIKAEDIKPGDIVTVLKNTTYDGKSFRLWYDKYDVISVSGDRVVIGIGKTVTCAVKRENVTLA